MTLIPTFGNYSPSKKECLITLDGEHESSLEDRYRPSKIININQAKLLPIRITWVPIENIKIDINSNEEIEIVKLLESLIHENNVIIHTNDINKISQLIKNNIYGFGNSSVGIGTFLQKTIEEWYQYVLNERSTVTHNDYFKINIKN